MDLTLNYRPWTGLVVSDALFGGNALYKSNDLDVGGSYDRAVDMLGMTGVRYPGGYITEQWGARFYENPNENPKNFETGYTFVGLDDFLAWSTAHRHPATLVLPTSHLFVGKGVGDAPRELDQDAVHVIGAFVADLMRQNPDALIAGFEIGNEYYSRVDDMTGEEYGILADAVSRAVQRALDDVLGADADQPKIYVQMGEQWGRDFDPGGKYDDPALSWEERVAIANDDILDQLSQEAKAAIDGGIEHYYYVGTDDALTLGDALPWQADLHFQEIRWDIAQWRAAFDGFGEFDIAITEWGPDQTNWHQFGLKSAGLLIEMFEGLLKLQADVAHVWPIELDSAVDLAGHHDGSDGDALTPMGEAFRLLSENVRGLEMLNNGLNATDRLIEDVEVNSFGGEDRFVFFLSSRAQSPQEVSLDVSAYVSDFSTLSGTRITLADQDASLTEAKWFATTETLNAASLGGGTTIDVTLGAYEVVMVEYRLGELGTGPTAKGILLQGRQTPDQLIGGAGGDRILGRGGDDNLKGRAGDDVIVGHGGGDRMVGARGDDLIKAGRGADRALGGAGDDVLRGAAGQDRLVGGKDDDQLFGGAGDDRLVAGTGHDVLKGGAGRDVFVFNGAGFNEITDYQDNLDKIIIRGHAFEDLDVRRETFWDDGVERDGTLIDWGEGAVFLDGVNYYTIWPNDFL